ncbi:hypothetical protein F2Q69_00006396 [Brassica cretica]|uniref:Uncharacterized protein n=1 Tax=Brassica cretica TaxID=69181 RepID=A0A8S9P3K8_BRACR|nr:hypothetical protein F2Q69_00006396 [Brassica cretica]
MLPAARLQLYLPAKAMISSISAGSLHAHRSTSTHHAHCSISTCLPSVPAMCPLEQMTPTNYRDTWSQGYVPIRPCAHWSPVLPRLRRRNITRILTKISQPQPPGGKRQLLLTGPTVRTAGNTSPWEDSTMLTSVARFDALITDESLLVPAGYRSQPGITFLQSLGTTSSGRVYNFDELQKLWEPEEEFLEILQAYKITTKSRSTKGTLPKHREHCRSASCKRAKENANSTARGAGPHTLYSFGEKGSKSSRRSHVPSTIQPNHWVPERSEVNERANPAQKPLAGELNRHGCQLAGELNHHAGQLAGELNRRVVALARRAQPSRRSARW